MKNFFLLLFGTVCLLSFGCSDPYAEEKAAAKKEGTATGIIGQTTDDIGEYDPNAALQTVSDGKMKEPSPLNPLGAMNAYSPAVEKLSKQKIMQAVNLFWAEKGHYPKTHQEFMDEIVKKNSIQLPVLPGDRKYQYDVANHELKVVMPIKENEK